MDRRRQRLRPRRRLRAGPGLRHPASPRETARFGQPEIDLGITPGFGGTQRLPRASGHGLGQVPVPVSGRSIGADEALRIGLVQAVFPCETLMDEAMKLAGELAGKSPLAMRYCKSALHYSRDVDIDTGQEIERDLFALCFASEDQTEGMAAFLEKRKPDSRGARPGRQAVGSGRLSRRQP